VTEHRLRLLLVEKLHVEGVETPEVDQFARRVDLRLEDALRLVEHAGCVQSVAPRTLEELGGLEHHRSAVFPGGFRPLLPGLGGGVDRHLNLRLTGLVVGPEHVVVVVRADCFGGVAGADLLAADDERDVDFLGQHLRDFCLERNLFRRTGSIRFDWIIDRRRDRDDSIGHDGPPEKLNGVVCGAQRAASEY
jgi:hypothetical protein